MIGGRSMTMRCPRVRSTVACAVAASALVSPGVTAGAAQPRIVGGAPAPGGSWSTIAALLRTDTADPRQAQFCDGTLVQRRWVLTAAHCAEYIVRPGSVEVAVGNRALSSITAGDRLRVSRIMIHPNRNTTLNTYDAALLELESDPRVAGTYMRLADPGTWTDGQLARVAGWGATQTNPDIVPDSLQEAQVPIQSQATCAQLVNGYDAATMLCAGPLQGGVDTCYGDSGGPLTVPDGAGGALQAGITSFGSGCAQPNSPGVYARVDSARPWIYSVLSPQPVADVHEALGSDAQTVTVTWTAADTGSEPARFEVLDVSSGARQTVDQPAAVFRTLRPRAYLFQVTPFNSFGRASPVSAHSTVTIPETGISLPGTHRYRVRHGRLTVPCRAFGTGTGAVCKVRLWARVRHGRRWRTHTLGTASAPIVRGAATLRIPLARSARRTIHNAHGRLAITADLAMLTVAKGRRSIRVRITALS